ncbi:hypothetical protein PAHAL_6G266900 [Panicum hallii]|uniref:Uncharacterized protein n=1 Tax=Panicum hallii TaxID=206008 RepID=A0A2S3I3U3_9POAL|nr:hypothetical protein PAHAL_6G266900 [Panicum hallii]
MAGRGRLNGAMMPSSPPELVYLMRKLITPGKTSGPTFAGPPYTGQPHPKSRSPNPALVSSFSGNERTAVKFGRPRSTMRSATDRTQLSRRAPVSQQTVLRPYPSPKSSRARHHALVAARRRPRRDAVSSVALDAAVCRAVALSSPRRRAHTVQPPLPPPGGRTRVHEYTRPEARAVLHRTARAAGVHPVDTVEAIEDRTFYLGFWEAGTRQQLGKRAAETWTAWRGGRVGPQGWTVLRLPSGVDVPVVPLASSSSAARSSSSATVQREDAACTAVEAVSTIREQHADTSTGTAPATSFASTSTSCAGHGARRGRAPRAVASSPVHRRERTAIESRLSAAPPPSAAWTSSMGGEEAPSLVPRPESDAVFSVAFPILPHRAAALSRSTARNHAAHAWHARPGAVKPPRPQRTQFPTQRSKPSTSTRTEQPSVDLRAPPRRRPRRRYDEADDGTSSLVIWNKSRTVLGPGNRPVETWTAGRGGRVANAADRVGPQGGRYFVYRLGVDGK